MIDDETKIAIDGKAGTFSSLAPGDKISVYLNTTNSVAIKMHIIPRVSVVGNEQLDIKRPSRDEGQSTTVVAEGVGKDEKEARRAAFRDAVSKVVGTLIDSETRIKNDQIISERVLEFSGGFIKTYESLKTETVEGGLIHIRIKAVVEKLPIVGRLADAKVITRALIGSDLLAEKLTKEEARRNATELTAKLLEDLPNLMQAEIVGKPRLGDNDTIRVDVRISVHQQKYGQFVKKATALFDKICIAKDSVVLRAAPSASERGIMVYDRRASSLFTKPDLGERTPKGWTVWILTCLDCRSGTARWNAYWIDADVATSLRNVAGEPYLHLALSDNRDRLVTEDKLKLGYAASPLPRDSNANWWLLYRPYVRPFVADGKRRETISLVIAPFAMSLGNSADRPLSGYMEARYSASVNVPHTFRLLDDELERVKTIKASVQLHARDRNR